MTVYEDESGAKKSNLSLVQRAQARFQFPFCTKIITGSIEVLSRPKQRGMEGEEDVPSQAEAGSA